MRLLARKSGLAASGLAASLIALACAGCGGGDGNDRLTEVEHLELVGDATVPAGEYTIRTAAELNSMARYFTKPVPSASLPASMVVGLSRGASRVCLSLRIVEVEYAQTQTIVRFKETFTFIGSSCLSPSPIQSGTTGDFVLVPAANQPVVFEEVK